MSIGPTWKSFQFKNERTQILKDNSFSAYWLKKTDFPWSQVNCTADNTLFNSEKTAKFLFRYLVERVRDCSKNLQVLIFIDYL